MVRRWAAWTVVLVILVAMAAVRLADRKERLHRTLSNVTIHEPGERGSGEPVRMDTDAGAGPRTDARTDPRTDPSTTTGDDR
jgi:hypothetical protein